MKVETETKDNELINEPDENSFATTEDLAIELGSNEQDAKQIHTRIESIVGGYPKAE